MTHNQIERWVRIRSRFLLRRGELARAFDITAYIPLLAEWQHLNRERMAHYARKGAEQVESTLLSGLFNVIQTWSMK